MKFEENQIVKFVPYADGSNETPLRVKKVWKDGGITTAYLNGRPHGKYKSNGYTRGEIGGYGRIVPLADGETLETIVIANKAKDDARVKEQSDKEAARLSKMNEWLAGGGADWWASRQIVEGFKVATPETGENELSVVRYREHGEDRIAVVTISIDKEWDDKIRYELSIGGLVQRGKYCSSFCTSTSKAATIDECVYQAFRSVIL